MAITQIRRPSRIPAADDQAPGARGGRSGKRRTGSRLWALLNAQALLDGTAEIPDGVFLAEDDSRRMAQRRTG